MFKLSLLFVASFLCFTVKGAEPLEGFRPPAVPLVNWDPYMDVYSFGDHLYDGWPVLWTGSVKAMTGLIRIDSVAYRFMGAAGQDGGSLPSPMDQESVTVYPTTTIYTFSKAGVQLTVTFTTPMVPDSEYDLISRPVTYIQYKIISIDNREHAVDLYHDNTAEWAVNSVDQQVVWNRVNVDNMVSMRVGTSAQEILGRKGDYVGIDWGYMYLSTGTEKNVSSVMAGALTTRNTFTSTGKLPTADDTRMPRKCSDDWPTLALAWSFTVRTNELVSRALIMTYDDIYSVKYFGQQLKPYWTRSFNSIETFISFSWEDMDNINTICTSFDQTLFDGLAQVGGLKYATVTSLAYRQTFSAGKMVWNRDNTGPWYMLKEISSNGDFSTVDVIFPASPLFALADPELLRLLLLPILAYANNETNSPYSSAWAPHHIGTYPIADIRTDQQEDMPVEETGNMLLMIALITKLENRVDSSFDKYWPLLLSWADYLISSLPDTENQLCTDDFEGPIPHDANLAVKGILALGAFSYVCTVKGDAVNAAKYNDAAQGFVSDWLYLANPDNADHYRLRYDEAGWSTKYNLLYQRLLDISVFPESVFGMETKYYHTRENRYGFPLDCRNTFAKLDWEAWAAAQANNSTFFAEVFDSIYEWANVAPDRVPLTDLYYTDTAKQYINFRARPVVGGLFAPLLLSKM